MPLQGDENLKFKKASAQLVPSASGVPSGWVLSVVSDDGYDWRNPPEAQILHYPASPDGALAAPENTPCIEDDDQSFWINSDGDTAWTQVGGGTASFPVTRDDGTNTYSLDAGLPNWGTGQFALHQELDATFATYADIITSVVTDDSEILLDAQSSSGGEAKINLQGHNSADTGNVGLTVNDGHSNLAELVLNIDNGATPKSYVRINAGENLWEGPNAAAASGDLNAGWFSFWLDSTNGAGKLMIKAKTADGTVVTGSVNLA